VNVAAILSLATIGFQATRVEIVADPNISRNIHEITAEGEFGRLRVVVENKPSTNNPKTSYLAVLSAIRKLAEINETISIGT
jgi:aspartate dehydrogenase